MRSSLDRWVARGALVGTLALLAGCADDETKGDCPKLREDCTIAEEACQRRIFAATACIRGQRGATLPPIRTISREEYADELRGGVAPEEDFGTRVWGKALGLFGLIPLEQSLQESDIAQRVGSVAAFYRRDSKDVTIIADTTMSRRGSVLTLSHEFVHALQDERERLQPFYDEHARNSDSQLALRCLTEGEAVVLSNLTLLHFEGTDPGAVDWVGYFGRWRDEKLTELVESDAPLLAARSLVYPIGGAGVLELVEREGVDAVRGVYAAPPHTLHYWAELPDGLREADEVDCDVPPPPEGFALRYVDRQGLAGLVSLYVGLGHGDQSDAAAAWRSDVFSVFSDPDEKSDEVLASWRIRLDGDTEAERLAAWVDEFVAESGRALRADVQGREVLLTTASTSELLEGWTDRNACTGSEKSRRTQRAWAAPPPRSWPHVDALH